MEHELPHHENQHRARTPELARNELDQGATRRAMGTKSVEAAMLPPSSSDGLGSQPGKVQRFQAQQQERLRKPMPIMLATSGKGADAERVAAMLDEQGIAYSTVFVETYDRPRLQVGAAELVGETEIAAHLAEIRELSLT